MELDELLDREGLDPHELLTWAHGRAEQLLAELTAEGQDELARLLEPAGQIDLDGVPVRRVAVAQDMLPAGVDTTAGAVEAEADESITVPISIEAAVAEQAPNEPDAAELGSRGRRRVPSTPQPLSASELPPPPEHPRLADGEPEPMLETVDTGPIDLATPEARAMIVANSTRTPLVEEPEPESAGEVPEPVAAEAPPQVAVEAAPASEADEADEPPAAAASEAAASETDASESDASEEFEIDELEEIDDEELELLVDVDDSGDAAEVPPPPPPRPPPSKPAAAPPPKPVDNEVDMDDLIAGLADSES